MKMALMLHKLESVILLIIFRFVDMKIFEKEIQFLLMLNTMAAFK